MDKKHRKTSTTVEVTNHKAAKEDVYANVVKFEEKEAEQRSADKDSQIFYGTCDKIRKIFSQVADQKLSGRQVDKTGLNELRIDGSFQFLLLKKLNRLDKVRLRSGRDTLHHEKLRVDSNRLHLQNLLYEAEHLRKEVQRCLQFKSQDEDIDLIDEMDFYQNAPESISRPDETRADEHARRLARLEWELQQRKDLAAMCKELQIAKEKVAQDIDSKTDRIVSLGPRLDDLLKATRPLQEALDLPIESQWEVKRTARLLSSALYLVYANLTAYGDACDKLLRIQIVGDEEEAKQLEADGKLNSDFQYEIPQESDLDDPDQDADAPSKSHHHRRKLKMNKGESDIDRILKPNPLSVQFQVLIKSRPSTLCVILNEIPALKIITVKCSVKNIDNIGIAAGDVISPDKILNSLDSNESQDNLYNVQVKYQLEKRSLNVKDLQRLLDEKGLGKPYRWAQTICGIGETFPSNRSDLVEETIPSLIRKIRNRWIARLALHKQIYDLVEVQYNERYIR